MARRAKITFVGPVIGFRFPSAKGAYFYLVQGAGESISLDYPSLKAARAARKLLLAGPLAHAVQDVTLLNAIQHALADASDSQFVGAEPVMTTGTEVHNGAEA
jgi:hypothetical protein